MFTCCNIFTLILDLAEENKETEELNKEGESHHVKTEETFSLTGKDKIWPECEKSLSCKQNLDFLKDCLNVHTKDKPYVCYLCGRSFGRMDALKVHQKRHNGVKDHACSECGKTFLHMMR